MFWAVNGTRRGQKKGTEIYELRTLGTMKEKNTPHEQSTQKRLRLFLIFPRRSRPIVIERNKISPPTSSVNSRSDSFRRGWNGTRSPSGEPFKGCLTFTPRRNSRKRRRITRPRENDTNTIYILRIYLFMCIHVAGIPCIAFGRRAELGFFPESFLRFGRKRKSNASLFCSQ